MYLGGEANLQEQNGSATKSWWETPDRGKIGKEGTRTIVEQPASRRIGGEPNGRGFVAGSNW